MDATGDTEICVNDKVVYADGSRRLHIALVTSVEADRSGFVTVRLKGASWTTPDRLAVVESA